MLKSIVVYAAALVLSPLSVAGAAETSGSADRYAPIKKINLKDGDSIVFLGDSITHQCLYTQYFEDYLYTRYPKIHLRIHNAGVGGDAANDGLVRFDMDVAAYKPQYVTVMLGMNDAGYTQWDATKFAAYEKGMLALLDRIKSIDATAIVMGPTMYDRAATLIKRPDKAPFDQDLGRYYNAVVAYYGAFIRDQALERGMNYVDLFGPLNELTAERRMKDPNFTMIPDTVHPDPNGHTVMAAAMIEDMHLSRALASTTATFDPASGWSVVLTGGGKASDIDGDKTHLRFTSMEPSLPWVLPADAALGYEISNAGHLCSAQSFRAVGLNAGMYDLKIDDQSVGTFPATDLQAMIELQKYEKCPQYQQALAVALLNGEKNEKVIKPIRDHYLGLKFARLAPKSTPETVEKAIADMKPKIEELEKSKTEYEKRIYELAQPKPHRFELTKVFP